MLRTRIDPWARYFPWLGLLLVVAGLLVWVITRRFDLAPNALVIAGVVLLAAFAMLRPYEIRELLGGQRAQHGANALLSILFLSLIGVLLYWLALQNSDWRLDVTETGEFTPLPETVALLEALDEPIHIIGFFSAQRAFQQGQAASMLDNLTAVTDKVSYEFKDPELEPFEAQRYELNFDGTLVFTIPSGDPLNYAKTTAITDRDIHTALVKVVNPVAKKLYLLAGHGEFDQASFEEFGIATVIAFVEDLGFEVETLNLFTTGAVPSDATVVALINQEAPLTEEELAALQTYWRSGGALFISRDVIDSEGKARAEEDGLNQMLIDDWGLRLRNDIIIDPSMAQAGLPLGFTFLGSGYGNSPIITDDLRNVGVLFDLSRSVESVDTAGVTHSDLVLTSGEAWGESNIELLASDGAVNPDPEDAQGELAVIVTAENSGNDARLVLSGDSDFVTNQAVGFGGNGLLFANALNWLADDEVAINLTAREQIDRQVVVPETQLRLLRTISIWLGPLMIAIIGLFVRQSRRNRP